MDRLWIPALLVCLFSCGSVPEREASTETVAAELLGSLQLLDGGTVDANAELAAGRHVALVFWQPWCGACQHEVPGLLEAESRFGDRLSIVSIVSGPDDAVDDDLVRSKVGELAIDYPVVRDRDLGLTHALAVEGTPTIVVVDPRHGVRYRGSHAPDWAAILGRR